MSQLNNTNENLNTDNTKKIKTSTKLIIFLVIFLIVSIGITIGAILHTNSKTTSSNIQDEPVEILDDGFRIKSLTEQYDENDLKIIDISDKKGTRTPKYDWDTNTGKINIEYIQIDGLKNTSIENKINNEIKNLVYSLYDNSELDDSKIDYIGIYAYYAANFGNTLSLNISKSIYYKDDDAEFNSTNYTLNYNLTTGNKIKFIDLFTNSSLKNALIQSIYDDVVSNYTYIDSPDGTIDMSKADLSTVEEETYILLNKLMNNLDNITFYYTPSYIYIYDYELSITMSNIYSNIAIYNRFKTTESIFDGTYEGNKNMFVFSKRNSYEDIQYSKYEDIYDNFRVEVSIEMDNDLLLNPIAKEKLTEIINKVENEISTIKKEAKDNAKKAFVYTAYFSLYSGNSFQLTNLGITNDILNTYGHSNVYRMTAEYYNTVFSLKIASFYNNPEPVEYWPVFEFYEEDSNVTIETISESNEDIDLYTNKSPDQLLGEYYITEQKSFLIEIQKSLNNGTYNRILENELTVIYNNIISIQKKYNLENSYIKEILDLIDEIRNNEKNKPQEVFDAINSTNIVQNPVSNIITN